ncbi:bifunctional (p)ppGpp synthetase/guanosine-3',5'-bis(diphosphate) 3'-pyrophosphohydrolase [Candidatus Micrarchaeota archaeon]|nr:bifunctional (p)ppGpp synthetase/guanosine-3',5'-bis(diphosphate) 3'-pyrophosphohydrolase [Candidatus Micrarchaeota archaeon]
MASTEQNNHLEGASPEELVHLTNIYSVFGTKHSNHYIEAARRLKDLKFPIRTQLAGLYHGIPGIMRRLNDKNEFTHLSPKQRAAYQIKVRQVFDSIPKKVKPIIVNYDRLRRTTGESEITSEQMGDFLHRISEHSADLFWIRAVDRYDRMRDFSLPAKHRENAANAALNFYVPLLKRINHYAFAGMLEDMALSTLNPTLYSKMEKVILDNLKISEKNAESMLRPIAESIPGVTIKARRKSVFSTFNKMFPRVNMLKINPEKLSYNKIRQNFNDKVRDSIAARVIVPVADSQEEKFRYINEAVEKLRQMFPGTKENPLFFKIRKRFIENPKQNGYQSIHAQVYENPKAKNPIFEIQIRDYLMDWLSEYGGQAEKIPLNKIYGNLPSTNAILRTDQAHDDYKNTSYGTKTVKPDLNVLLNLRLYSLYLKTNKSGTFPDSFELRSFLKNKKELIRKEKVIAPNTVLADMAGPRSLPEGSKVFDLLVSAHPYQADSIREIEQISPNGEKIKVSLSSPVLFGHTYLPKFEKTREIDYFKPFATTPEAKQWLSNKQKLLDALKKKK